MVTLEAFKPTQLENIRKMDRAVDKLQQIRTVMPFTQDSQEVFNVVNQEVFESFYKATREVTLEEGKLNIVVDRDMVKVASARLSQRGFPQMFK